MVNSQSNFSLFYHLEPLVWSPINNQTLDILLKYLGYDDTMNNPGDAAY